MAEALLAEFELQTESFTLIPSTGGVFEVMVGDQLAYSKKETGVHPDIEEVLEAVRALV